MQRLWFSQKGSEVFLGLIITFIFAWLSIAPPAFFDSTLARFENVAYDVRLSLLLSKHPHPESPVVIVDIDEKSLRQEGRWPWQRQKLAQLVQKLYAQGAAVIAFDMLFSEPEGRRNCYQLDEDATFAQALGAGSGKVILGTFLSNEHEMSIGVLPPPAINLTNLHLTDISLPSRLSYISNIEVLEKAVQAGGILSIVPDSDGVLRRYALLQRYGNNLYSSLALEAVNQYFFQKNISINIDHIGSHKVITGVNINNNPIHTDENGQVFIPYIGPAHTFTYYSASDILNNQLPADTLKNKVVFLGISAVGLGDVRATPVGSVYPGVEIHATVANGLFAKHFPYIPVWMPGARLSLIIIVGMILSGLFAYIGPALIGFISIMLMTSLFMGSTWLWQQENIILPIMLPMLLIVVLAVFNTAYGFSLESRRRGQLKRVFEQYVPPELVNKIMDNSEPSDMFEGERKRMTVLFMDIRDFTGIAEKLSIIELKKLLNFFLTEMTTVIFKHGGTVDKYVGDMIMAFWGAPLSDEDHALHALEAGLNMLQKLDELKLPSIRVGIGINTGMMNVGDMGSAYRRAYTVLGDAVNIASRLESLTRYYDVAMIVGEKVVAEINTKNKDTIYIFKLLDKVRLKGKQIAINIYEPCGLESEKSHEGLDFYFNQNWQAARNIFTDLHKKYPDCKLYKIYLERINHFQQHPPALDWDGVWEHDEK